MRIRRVAIEKLTPDPKNARAHEERGLEAIRRSLRRFGQQKPIVVDRDGVVVAGNGTLEAARAEGWSDILAVETDLEGDEARAFAVADNRTTDLSTWNFAMLGDVVQSFGVGFELEDIGFTREEIAAFVAQDWSPIPGDEKEAAEPAAGFGGGDATKIEFSKEQAARIRGLYDAAVESEEFEGTLADFIEGCVAWCYDSSAEEGAVEAGAAEDELVSEEP